MYPMSENKKGLKQTGKIDEPEEKKDIGDGRE